MTPRQRLLAIVLAIGLLCGVFALIVALLIGADPEQFVLLAVAAVGWIVVASRLRAELQGRVPAPGAAEQRRRVRALLGAAAGLVIALLVSYTLAAFGGARGHLAAAAGFGAGMVVGIPLMLLGFYDRPRRL